MTILRAAVAVLPALVLLAAPLAAEGQPAKKVPVIGYLIERAGPTAFDEGFRLGLRELGYSEGRNIVVEYRWADGKAERLPALLKGAKPADMPIEQPTKFELVISLKTAERSA